MANTYSSNVRKIDTSGAITGPLAIRSIKYIGSSSGSASVKASPATTAGLLVWQQSGSANWSDHDLNILASDGIYVTVGNSAIVYLYLK